MHKQQLAIGEEAPARKPNTALASASSFALGFAAGHGDSIMFCLVTALVLTPHIIILNMAQHESHKRISKRYDKMLDSVAEMKRIAQDMKNSVIMECEGRHIR